MKNDTLVDAHCHLNNELLLQDHDLINYWKSNNYKIFINSIINKKRPLI
ncbi:MAG TPA: hypothetical protein PL139_06325 [Candidatus Cloacimonadota bacterium]|nr:hypothetical protein [Candidatus Cloacimonadota bacterium]